MLRNVINNEIKKQGLQRQEVAIDIGMSNASLSNFLNGKSGMSINNLEKLLEYLNLCLTKLKSDEMGNDNCFDADSAANNPKSKTS